MARHTKIFNALLSFYKESIDDLVRQLNDAFAKRFYDSEEFDLQKHSFQEQSLSVVDLARDQSIHFCKRSELLPNWETELLVDEVCEYIEKQIREMKKKGVYGQSYKVHSGITSGAGSRWEQLDDKISGGGVA